MHVTDPSTIVVGVYGASVTLYAALSGRRERERQAALETKKDADKLRRENEKSDEAKEERKQTQLEKDFGRVKTLLDEAQAQIDMRNRTLAEFGTNYEEMFVLMRVPGAMDTLRGHQRATLVTHTEKTVTTTEKTTTDEKQQL